MRRPLMSVIGAGGSLDGDTEALCHQLGQRAVEAGFRLASGGLGGVMAAVSRGAHQASTYREGDVIGILPSYDGSRANPDVDIAIPTGMGYARNVVLVSMADVVVAVDGGSGTLSELAMAWQLGKPIVALSGVGGWSDRLAGEALDDKRPGRIERAEGAEQAVALALQLLSKS